MATKKKPKPKPAAKAAPAKAAPAKVAPARPAAKTNELTILRGELDRLTTARAKYPPLTPTLSAKLLQKYDDPTCRVKGSDTRAKDTFPMAVSWARIAEANLADPGLDAIRVRWFLDCATTLGNLLSGAPTSGSPGHDGALDDATTRANTLLERTERLLRDAAGGDAEWRRAIVAALTPDGRQNPLVSRLHQVSAQLKTWLGADAELLAAFSLTGTAGELDEAARALEQAIEHRSAAAILNGSDTPAVNVAEGRMLYAMRTIWDDLVVARADGKSSLKLTVSPSLLRGLDLQHRKSAKATSDATAAAKVPPAAPKS